MKQTKNLTGRRQARGFTLIELLVVIAIIGLLASVVLPSLNSARIKARDAARANEIKTLLIVLELYFSDNGEYPRTFNPGQSIIVYKYCQGHPADYIPDVVPTYISRLPSDPSLNCSGQTHAWSFASDGTNFKLITHPELGISIPAFVDPAWDGGSDPCIVDGSTPVHYGVWTYGARCWSI